MVLLSFPYQKFVCPPYCYNLTRDIKNYDAGVVSNGVTFMPKFMKINQLECSPHKHTQAHTMVKISSLFRTEVLLEKEFKGELETGPYDHILLSVSL